MEVAKKLALVTKVGGGNGVNLDVYHPRAATSRPDNGVRGWAYMSASHADVEDFMEGMMRPPTQPDGDKQPVMVRNWTRVVYGQGLPAQLVALARRSGVQLVGHLPEGVLSVQDDMGGIIDAARQVAENAKLGLEPRIDLSGMRPEGAPIKGSGGTSSGPVSFLLEIFDNFLEWANRGAEGSGPINTLRFVYSPVLRVVRQGGCLHPDTLVQTSSGTLRLRELVDARSFGHQGHALEVATDEGWRHSPEGFNNGLADTRRVLLESGLSIQGTPNHKLKVLRAGGEREWVRLDQMQPGDWVIQVLDQHTGAPVVLEPLDTQPHTKPHFNAKPITTPDTLNEELAFWLGYLWGDGFVSGNRVGFAVAHGSPMLAETPRLFRQLFGLELRQEQKPDDRSVVFVTRSAALVNWLSLNGLLKGRALTLEVPRAVRQAPRHVLGAFLRGLFEADGTVLHGYPQLSSASRRLAEDVAVLLGGLGMPAKVTRYEPLKNRYSQREHYRLNVVSAKGLERFVERVGWLEGSRLSVLGQFQPDLNRESAWPLPHAQGLLGDLHRSLPAGRKGSPSEFTQARKTLSRYIRGERSLTASSYSALTHNAQIAAALPAFEHQEYYVQVREVTAGERILTLDLSVDDNHTYLANGMVSHNTRRGAGMATISVSHPDVLDFLTAKDLDREAAEGDISTFNISILVTNAFWDTLQAGGLWPLQAQAVPGKYQLAPQAGEYPGTWPQDQASEGLRRVPLYTQAGQSAVPAAWLWHEVARHAWSTGEPGLIFVDRINEFSALKNLGERYQIRSTNPCGEIPLTVGEPCDLGAINLAAYVSSSVFDYQSFRADVRTCVRFLDDVLDVNVFALEDNRVASQDLRRLGLGVMGLADALIKLGLRYDSQAGRDAIYGIMSALREEAVAASEALGRERGVYPVYQRHAAQVPHEPRRNVAVLTVAPTGCVVPNTLVSTDRGMRRIVTLGNPSGQQWQNLDTGVYTDEGVKRATKFFVNGFQPVKRVTTSRGFSMAATANHQVRVIEEGGEYVWRRMDALNVGDQVLLKRNTIDDAPMVNLELAEIGVNGVSTVPGRMNVDLAELLGLYMGDGYIKEKGGLHIVIGNADVDLKERISHKLMKVFTAQSAPVEEKLGCCIVMVNGRCISRFFNLNNFAKPKGNYGEGAEGAFIPDAILASGAQAVRAFLRGLFEADGTVTPQGRVALSSVSLTLMQQVQAAMLGLGMVTSLRQMPTSTGRFGQRPIFELSLLNRHEVDAFRTKIGFLSARKRETLDQVATGYAKCDVFTNPLLLEEFYQASRGLANETRQGLNKRVHANAALSQPYVKELLGQHPQLQETRLGRLSALDVFIDTVAVIEDGFSETYDLSVPENVTYIANGFISHNTTSMLMGVSSGIEPVFSPFIWRKIGSEYRALLAPLFVELLESYPPAPDMERAGPKGQRQWDWDKVTEAVSENHGSVVGLDFIPQALQQVFVCAHDIAPLEHVRMQGVVQRAFDAEGYAGNSLSKTINLPNSATVQEIEDAYSEAYRTGCKGITVYRDGSRQFQVLSTSKKKEKKAEAAPVEVTQPDAAQPPSTQPAAEVMGEAEVMPVPAPVQTQPVQPQPIQPQRAAGQPLYQRPGRLRGVTDMVKLTDPSSGHRRSFLVTVNCLEDRPVEVMVISGRAGDEANADSEALGRVVSIALQHGVPASAIVKTLRGLSGGLYGSYNGRLVGSKADLIAVALETFAQDLGEAKLPVLAGGDGLGSGHLGEAASGQGVSVEGMSREKCPVCEERAVIREEGCLKCQACGYSKCG